MLASTGIASPKLELVCNDFTFVAHSTRTYRPAANDGRNVHIRIECEAKDAVMNQAVFVSSS